MSNFAFVKATLPDLHQDCVQAESYMTTDPRSACIYSRRVVEELVRYLYNIWALQLPYRNDLVARINDNAFKSRIEPGIRQKLNAIRKLGNTAVHESKPVAAHVARQVLHEVHHVLVWAAFNHSPNPTAVPLGAPFDPAAAAKLAPLSREQMMQLAAKFKAQDQAHAQTLAAKNELLAQHEAEIKQLREQIKAAQATKAETDTRDYAEAETRSVLIDTYLSEAGWPLDAARDREYKVQGMPNSQGVGYIDYVLWGTDGLPLAIVEAKRTNKSALSGQQQAKLYADCLEAEFGRRPVIFCTNGDEHWIWDDASGYAPRAIRGFYTRDELELAIHRRQARLPLGAAPINKEISGRYYQERAIRAVGDTFDAKTRKALLVMATGSGKTRTAVALVDQLMKANWVKRVLFLADRTALVNQAAEVFKTHLPEATTVNLVTEKATEGRVYVSTYPTMMNLIELRDGGERRFGPGFFDLVIIDEAHRSVYAKYGAIFEWFDSLLVGLTATPKEQVDHNTYALFELEDGNPTDAYSLDEAVADGYLVPPKSIAVGTRFLRSGIRYDDLPEHEQAQWDELDWGEDDPPTEIGAEEINRFLFNTDTVDKVLATLMEDGYKVAGGDRLGKTIIFAKSQAHAEFVQQRFDAQYPHHGGHFARVITHSTAYADSLIRSFSTPDKDPQIAISVDMLDTGIDVPDVVNLVFFKLIRSKSKFWQMIGRGTRLRPDLFGPGQDKQDFYVFDFCGNLEYFSQDLPEVDGSRQKSLTQRLVEGRVALLRTLGETEPALRSSMADLLSRFVSGMNLDNVLVRPHRSWAERFSRPAAWGKLTAQDADEVVRRLAALPSASVDRDEYAKRFDLLVLHRQLAQLEGDAHTAERVREAVQAIAVALLGKTTIPTVMERAELLESVSGDQWWVDVTLPMLESMRLALRSLAGFVRGEGRSPVYTDFEDELGEATAIGLPGVTPGVDAERFRAKATAFLRRHEDHIALQRLRRNKQLTEDDLSELQSMLLESGGGAADIEWASENGGGLGIFVRSLVGLDRAAAAEAFGDFLDDATYTVDQIRFINLIIDELTSSGVVEPRRLFESPYVDHAPSGPEFVFSGKDVGVIIEILGDIKGRAVPEGAA